MEQSKKGHIEVIDENGEKIGYVFVYPSKELGKRDIIYYDIKKRKAKSLRSITELINLIAKKVSIEEIKKTISFVEERLIDLG
ncbi:MAG TPA: hypothetical protein ENG63_06595 [Candidatus Desulfofervidus auxilii]|uniref:Uncharacterized protein n=1 Tax=Desulfofervidus auxilii TaxID=1621989 RepID=A0A7C0Y606_DESA2|nr:hypothetical protein [Candidatus Desulfofervidus auxilii]